MLHGKQRTSNSVPFLPTSVLLAAAGADPPAGIAVAVMIDRRYRGAASGERHDDDECHHQFAHAAIIVQSDASPLGFSVGGRVKRSRGISAIAVISTTNSGR
jgi:hypothetical protein